MGGKVGTARRFEVHKNVVWFDVPMSDAEFMQLGQTIEELEAKLLDLSIPRFDLPIVRTQVVRRVLEQLLRKQITRVVVELAEIHGHEVAHDVQIFALLASIIKGFLLRSPIMGRIHLQPQSKKWNTYCDVAVVV